MSKLQSHLTASALLEMRGHGMKERSGSNQRLSLQGEMC